MNNGFNYFNPLNNFIQPNFKEEYDKLFNKIERLEKNIRILENRLNKIEKIEFKEEQPYEPTDMYIL